MKTNLKKNQFEADNVLSPELIIDTITDKKGQNIFHIDLVKIPDSVTDHFIICEGGSTTQVKAIADHVVYRIKTENGQMPYNTEGFRNCEWVLIDYVDVVVHVFLKEKREFYALEDLWNDGELHRYSETGEKISS